MTGTGNLLKWARDVRAAYSAGLPVPDGALLEAHRALASASNKHLKQRLRASHMVALLEGEGIGQKAGGDHVHGRE